MKKLFLLTKTLLVTALLGLGASEAWGQISTWTASSGTYTSGQEITGGTSGVITMTLGTDDGWTYNSGRGAIYVANQTVTFTDNIPTAGGYVKITPTRTLNLKMQTYSSQNNCNVYMIEASAPTTKIKDFRQKGYNTNDYGTLEAGKTYYIYGGSYKKTGDLEYLFFKDFTATTIENYTIHFKDGEGNTLKEDVVYTGLYGATATASSDDMATFEYNSKSYAYTSGNEEITLTNGTNEITLVFTSASVADVTFKYEDTEGNSLSAYQADQVLEGVVVGTSISSLITDAYTTTFYNGETNKYIYANSYAVTGDYTEVQDGGNTVTLKFTDYPATAYTVEAQVSGSDLTELASGTAFLDGSTTVYWSKYVNYNDTWYEATNAVYGGAITAATTNVAYQASDISYFYECESMSVGHAVFNSVNNNTEFSNGSGVTIYADSYVKTSSTVASGIYNISLASPDYWGDYADAFKIQYSADGETWTDLGTLNYAASDASTQTIESALIPTASYVRVLDVSGHTPRHYVDYLTLTKIGDSAVSATIGSTGYTTFASSYALDLANLPDGLTAFYASAVGESSVTISSITEAVPAGTGLVLKGTASTPYSIPVAASPSALEGNLLVGCTSETVLDANANCYVLVNNGGTAQFQSLAEHGATIPAGKAYLNAAAGGARLSIVFDDETTGISTVENANVLGNGIIYNLNGQRVEKAQKGLYIIDGKKVMIK